MSEYAIRRGTAEDWIPISQLLFTVFHDTRDEDSDETGRAVFEPDRSLLIHDGDELVAHTGAFSRELSVPGSTVPAAHVTMVGVAPTHRRRGMLTRLMRRQLAEAPEPVAVLWASEGQIYPRFGYGMAAARLSLAITAREVTLPEPAGTGRLRMVPADKARPDLERVYESVRRERPGWSDRNGVWWSRILSDPPGRRRGATERRVTVYETDAGVTGYALWRTRGDWNATGPEGEVLVQEVVAADPDAYLALWRHLLSVDLTRHVKLWLSGLGEPLLHLVNEPRRLGARLGDGLYVRVVDLPAALTGRGYASAADLVIEVHDRLLEGNAGRWHLRTDGASTTCTRTDRSPDLTCDVAALGAAYLGAAVLGDLGLAGRVREHRPGALAEASAAFGWHRTPAGLEIF